MRRGAVNLLPLFALLTRMAARPLAHDLAYTLLNVVVNALRGVFHCLCAAASHAPADITLSAPVRHF